MKIVFPGSFDPITVGHIYIIEKVKDLFDDITVLVENNPAKKYMFDMDERVRLVKKALKKYDFVTVDTHEGLTVEYCREHGAGYILRGLRNEDDFRYEKTLDAYNHEIGNVETVYVVATEREHVSSSGVRELLNYGADIKGYVPEEILDNINKIKKNH